MINKIKKVVEYVENRPFDFRKWIFSFFAVISTRLLLENLIFEFKDLTLEGFVGTFLHTLLFFSCSLLIFLIYLKILTKEKIEKIANILIWGQVIIIFPPIIDKIIFKNNFYWSFYSFDSLKGLVERFFTFFGDNPAIGITYGVRIEVFIVLVALGIYLFCKKPRMFFVIGGVLGAYGILFCLGAFPSLLAVIIDIFKGKHILEVDSGDVARIFISPLSFFRFSLSDIRNSLSYKLSLFYNLVIFTGFLPLGYLIDSSKFWSLVKNIRYPQTIFNFGIFFIGVCLGFFYFRKDFYLDIFSFLAVLNLLLAIFSAWFFSVFINDLEDQKIDVLTNTERPLVKKIFTIKQFQDWSIVFFLLSITASLVVNPIFFLLIMGYHGLTWIYSTEPFRLKRFIGPASLLSSFASLLFLFFGFLLVSGGTFESFPWKIVALLMIGYTLAIPLKDLKDIEGDKKDNVWTIPVLLGEVRARLLLSCFIFSYYFISVYFINDKRMFFPALFCGGISFWIINNRKIKPRNINWQVLLAAVLYVILLVDMIFI